MSEPSYLVSEDRKTLKKMSQSFPVYSSSSTKRNLIFSVKLTCLFLYFSSFILYIT